jgi:hypothetical protein
MIHYLLVKMINQVVFSFDYQKDHFDHNNESKLTCLDLIRRSFLCLSFWVFLLENAIKKCFCSIDFSI